MADKIYIIGYMNPDTDTVAAAKGYTGCSMNATTRTRSRLTEGAVSRKKKLFPVVLGLLER